MTVLAEFEARGNQNTVNIHTGLAFKFKQKVHSAGIVGATAQNPSAVAQNRARQCLHQPVRFFARNRSHLHGPRRGDRLHRIAKWNCLSHSMVIGVLSGTSIDVQE